MAKRTASKERKELMKPVDEQELMEIDKIIPLFVWQRLKSVIQELPWEKASAACINSEPNSEVEAMRLYQTMFREMDAFIQRESKLPGISQTNSIQMKIEKRKIESQYEASPVAFVQAMAECLQREQTWQFLGDDIDSSSSQDSPELETMATEEIWESAEDATVLNSIDFLEQLIEITKHAIDDFNKCDQEMKNLSVNIVKKVPIQQETLALEDLNIDDINANQYSEIAQKRGESFQTAIANLIKISSMCEEFMKTLEKNIEEWRRAEVLYSARIGPETEFDEQPFSRFVMVLNTLMEWFSRPQNSPSAAMNSPQSHHPERGLLTQLRSAEMDQLQPQGPMCPQTALIENQLKKIEEAYVKRTIIVSQQPPEMVGVMGVDNPRKKDRQSMEEEPAEQKPKSRKSSAGDEGKKYSSKKEQKFNTKIKIPGGQHFSSLWFDGLQIECVLEAELAAEVQGSKTAGAEAVPDAKGKGSLHSITPPPSQANEIEFNEVRIANYSRLNPNNVHKEFVRICYSVSVSVNSRQYDLQVLSLPFLFNTGSNQLLLFIGTRLWYYGSSPDMYCGNFKFKEELSEKEVLDLLDKCVRQVDSRGRNLRIEEKEYLSKMLPKGENGKVKLQDFVGTKAVPPKKPEFTFYTWFHAVVNTIKTLWLEAWLDGAVYGLIGREQAHELLDTKSVPNGAILLRPTTTVLEKTSSVHAVAALTMHAKYKTQDPDTKERKTEFIIVQLPPDFLEKNGFYNAVTRVFVTENGEQRSFAEYLMGYGLQKKIDFLEKYETKPTSVINFEYETSTEKHVYIEVKPLRGLSLSSLSNLPSGSEEKKRKSASASKKPRKSKSGSSSKAASGSTSVSPSRLPAGDVAEDIKGNDGSFSAKRNPTLMMPSPRFKDQCVPSGNQTVSHDSPMVITSNTGNGQEVQNFSMYNGVQIDTSALPGSFQTHSIIIPGEGGGSDLIVVKTEANTMSPTSESQMVSLDSGCGGLTPPAEMQTMSPPDWSQSFTPHSTSQVILPAEGQPGATFQVLSTVSGFGGIHTIYTGELSEMAQNQGLNIPTIIDDAML